MTDSGPTTVGSIVGKLKLDDSAWNADLDKAEAKAHKLGTIDPTIKVDAQVDKAMAKLAAVDAAQTKLGVSAERLKIAYQRLDEIQGAGTAKQSTLMAAHLAATQAENAHERATRDLAAAELALAAATDDETAATVRSNTANGRRMAHWQVIALLIAGLIPLMGPLAGYLTSVGGGFLAMGAAGVLAIVGIKRAMEEGNGTGKQYRAGLRDLKTGLNGLSDTAAVSMLRWFRTGVDQINAAMPMLNGQVGTFSNILGSAGNHLLEGVITALRILNPLFVTGALYIDKMAAGFAGWSADGGLQKFASYAIEMLPRVSKALGELILAALHLIEAMSPIGTVMLTILTGFAQAINALPNEALLTIAASAIAVVVAFKAWSGIAAIVSSVGASIGGTTALAGGLPGLIIAASVAFDMLALSASKAASSGISQLFGQAKTVDDYSAAIRRGNIDINHLGTTLSIAGGFWGDLAKNMDFTGTGMSKTYDEITKLDQAMAAATPEELAASYAQLLAEGEKVGKSAEDIAALYPLATAAYIANGAAAVQTTTSTSTLGSEIDRLEGKAAGAAGEVEGLSDRIRGFASATLDTRDAQRQFEAAIDTVGSGLQAQRDAYELANGSLDGFSASLDIGTEAGRQNEAALDAIATAAQKSASDIYTQSGSQDLATAAIQRGRDALIEQLAQFGIVGDAANTYADTLGLVPADISTTLRLLGIAQNEKLMDAFVAKYQGKTITMSMFLDSSGGNTTAAADAARLTGYALNYIEHHADGGTVGGVGTARSDSNVVRLSRGEEVTREAAASSPGVRPLLKALNANPVATMANIAAGMGGGKQVSQTNHIYEATNARQVGQVVLMDLIGLGA